MAICYPFITDSTILDQTSIFVLVLVLGVNGSLEFFTLAKYRALLTADQRTYVISLASIVYAKWYIGYHSLDDLKRLLSFADKMNLREITIFRS